MGVSFKVAKTGKRYRHKYTENGSPTPTPTPTEPHQIQTEGDLAGIGDRVANPSNALAKSESHLVSQEHEVSFSLNLFPNGFSVGKANELPDDVPKQLLPYDRASESLFCAIEYGYLPGDAFDDIPCKYVDGALLCEIRDYRNTLYNTRNTSVEKSPLIYKVVLHMSMENVVKDISSVSDDSWTYSDLLEVESRILKALRPVLYLNPKPVLDRLCGKAPAKKLNLGIGWSWKKIKLDDTSATDLVFRNIVPGGEISHVSVTQSSKSQVDLAFQNTEVPHFQQIIPTSGPISEVNLILQQTTTSEPFPVLSESNHPLPGNCRRSVSEARKLSNCISTPKLSESKCHSGPRNPTTLSHRASKSCGTTLKIPKQEPLDFSLPLLPGVRAESGLAPEQHRKAAIVLNERTDRKEQPPVCINSGQQANLEYISKLQAGMTTFRVKAEPMEISELPLEAGKITDNCKTVYQFPMSSSLFRATGLPTARQMNHFGPALRISHVSTKVENSADHRLKGSSTNRFEFLARTSSMNTFNAIYPADVNRVESLAITSSMTAVNAICHPEMTLACWPPAVDDPVVDRFLKLKMVTQRYGQYNRKNKLSQVSERRPSFCSARVALYLSYVESSADSLHASSLDDKLNLCKRRILTFVRSSRVSQRDDICSCENQNKLIMTEKLVEGIVEASVIYGHESIDPIVLPCLQTFPDSRRADLFAVQFTVLMARERYHLVSDKIEHVCLDIDGSPISLQTTVAKSTIPTVEISELPSQSLNPQPSPSTYLLGASRSTATVINPSQLSSQNTFLGGHLLPRSSMQPPASYPPETPFDIAAQLGIMDKQWQRVHKKLAFNQLQKMGREMVQQQLLQRKMMMGRLEVAMGNLGSTQTIGGGVHQGFGNPSLGSINNVNGVSASSMSIRGHIHGTGYIGEVNAPPSIFAKTRISEPQHKASMSGFPMQRNVSIALTCPPDSPAIAYNNQQRETRPQFLNVEAISLAEHVGQFVQSGSHKLGAGLVVPQQVEAYGSPELTSRTPGSVSSVETSTTPMELLGVICGGNPTKSGGIK